MEERPRARPRDEALAVSLSRCGHASSPAAGGKFPAAGRDRQGIAAARTEAVRIVAPNRMLQRAERNVRWKLVMASGGPCEGTAVQEGPICDPHAAEPRLGNRRQPSEFMRPGQQTPAARAKRSNPDHA
jgi:hypothetical protein